MLFKKALMKGIHFSATVECGRPNTLADEMKLTSRAECSGHTTTYLVFSFNLLTYKKNLTEFISIHYVDSAHIHSPFTLILSPRGMLVPNQPKSA